MDTCSICGGSFRRHYRRKGLRQVFCSKACSYRGTVVKTTCKTCGKEFERHPNKASEYCSRECIVRSPCKLCGKIITGKQAMNGHLRIFCSRSCAAIFNKMITRTASYRSMGLVYTILRRGRLECEKCQFDNPLALQVHHKRGQNAGHDEENLITLCANCHEIEHRTGTVQIDIDIKRAHQIAPLIAASRQIATAPFGQQTLALPIEISKRLNFVATGTKRRRKSPSLFDMNS